MFILHNIQTVLLSHPVLVLSSFLYPWKITWVTETAVLLNMLDCQRWTSVSITQSWRCFKTSTHDTCQPQSHMPSTLLPKLAFRVRPSFTSTAIIHQIYLHGSRAKIKPDPRAQPLHPVRPGQIQSQLDTFYDWLASNPIEFLLLVRGPQPARLKVIMHWQEGDMWRRREERGGGTKETAGE